MPQAHGCQPEPSARWPQPPSQGSASVSKINPISCMYSMARNVPMRWVAQQVGGGIGGYQFTSAKFEPLSAKMRDATIGFKQGLCSDAAEADNHFGRDGVELAQQEWRTSLDFLFFRRAIVRRPAFHHVANVDILALQAHGFDHLRQ